MLCGDLYQLLGIGRMMTANDNNDVALLAEVFRFLLPRPRRITYCIKNSGVCIGFFEKLRTFLPFCYLKCGLCNCKNGLLGVRRPFPRLQLGQIAENEYLSPGMSDDALHLRMGHVTGHHEYSHRRLRPRKRLSVSSSRRGRWRRDRCSPGRPARRKCCGGRRGCG